MRTTCGFENSDYAPTFCAVTLVSWVGEIASETINGRTILSPVNIDFLLIAAKEDSRQEVSYQAKMKKELIK